MPTISPPTQPIIIFDHVNFAYNDTFVLHNVTCQINQGEFVGIIGPNGGGKTTFLKLAMGFLKPTTGQIQVFGQSPSEALAKIAYVPQTTRYDKLFPISVKEVVLMGRLAHLPWYGRYGAADKEAAADALQRVGLSDFANRAFGTLSGGQAQRTLIARALASDPSLLLLDEPTASVDPRVQGEIYTLLQQLAGSMTIVMVTHDLNMAMEHVQKVLCVQNNAVMLTPKEVCEHFALGLYHTPLITALNSHKKIPQ